MRIAFKPLPRDSQGAVIGRCQPFLQNISIDPIYWNEATYIERKALIFHELSHCLLWKMHDNEIRKDFCPKSIMHHSMPNLFCLQKHWNNYILDILK